MDKVLVCLYVPVINEYFDVLFPTFLPIKELCSQIGKTIEEVSGGRYVSSGCEILCSVDRSAVLNGNNSLMDYRIQNGDRLMFC